MTGLRAQWVLLGGLVVGAGLFLGGCGGASTELTACVHLLRDGFRKTMGSLGAFAHKRFFGSYPKSVISVQQVAAAGRSSDR